MWRGQLLSAVTKKKQPLKLRFQEHWPAEMEESGGSTSDGVTLLLSQEVTQTLRLVSCGMVEFLPNDFCPESGPRSSAPAAPLNLAEEV